MKKIIISALLVSLAGVSLAAPEQPAAAKEPSGQQSKMSACNKEAADKKGDERKAFMKQCLSQKAPATGKDEAAKADAPKPKTAQQEKMKTCNADAKAKDLKGDERKAFMKQCLSSKK
jgi:hypothetical protein